MAWPVPKGTRETLRAIIRQKVPEGATIHPDQSAAWDGLITQGYRHPRIHHGQGSTAGRRRHNNGVENFWGYAETKLKRCHTVLRNQLLPT